MALVVVTGYMIRHPVAGNVWAFFHYVLGLKLLGHKVIYLEESGWSNSVYNPWKQEWQEDPQVGIDVVRGLITEHHIEVPVYYVNRESGQTTGGTWSEIKQALREADLLINIGGVCWLPEFRLCRRRVLIDMDPFFTQIGKFGSEGINEYHAYFSYGGNIGKTDCPIPTLGIDWHPIVPPVVPEVWEGVSPDGDAPLTTVANWKAYGSVTYEGEEYGQKKEEFLRILHLPEYTSQKLDLALAGVSDEETAQLEKAGWLIRSAEEVGVKLESYKNYILNSRGEFSVAKNAYVKTNSGWFSDRSVCYLAAGLPVIVQETGFSNFLPTGRGILSFSTLAEAAQAIGSVNSDYSEHRNAAREIAENVFGYRIVLTKIFEAAMK
ncbi:MAG: hypothetical protein H0U96_08570 [Acidobacteria bacterium]|nr:hypothetical protein [Acidobacteriota bacterium]